MFRTNVLTPLSHKWRVVLAVWLLLCTGLAWAQDDSGQNGDSADPPARVARLAYASGDLGLMPAGSTEWNAADVNRPLTNGDKLSSGPGARAELDLGGASLRINDQSDIGVLNLNDQIGQFELTQGTLSITVRNLDQGATYEIDTPTLALVINQPGTFRVDVGANGNGTNVSVFDGGAVVYGENSVQREVFSGRSYQFADSSLNDMTVSDIQGRDEFDAWCNDRDAQYTSADNTQYVSSDVVGGDDLNQYGDWQQDEDYGSVWYPTGVAAGWAPYSLGHWIWVGPWGWTWVDAMPWGFAPYHYGRWAFLRGRWGWIPGPRHVRPVYAPALVAFVGMGRGGPVGWFPLGPHEVYNPWYRASRNYYTNVNLTNIRVARHINRTAVINNIHNQYGLYRAGRPVSDVHYINRGVPHALTTVSAQAFASARNVQSNRAPVDPRAFAGASVISPAMLQRPQPASLGRPRTTSTHPLPSAGFNRPVIAVRPPAPSVAARDPAHAGQPASNVRVLSAPQSAPRVVSGQAFPRSPAPQTAPRAAPSTLPQIPHFAPAQQVQQVPRAPHYAPTQPSMLQEREQPSVIQQRERFDAAERAHQYVPEQPQRQAMPMQPQREPNPSYEPYRPVPMPASRPEPGRPMQAPHPQQGAPHPHPVPRSDNQH